MENNFYRVETFWLEADGTCNHEPDSWDFHTMREACEKYDAIDVREEFLRERKQYYMPSKFKRTACQTIYEVEVDEDGYEHCFPVGDNDYIQFGYKEYEEEEELKHLYDVYSDYDKKVDFNAAQVLMDAEVVDELHSENWFETNQEFFDAYCEKHLEKYGEVFEPNKRNPVW